MAEYPERPEMDFSTPYIGKERCVGCRNIFPIKDLAKLSGKYHCESCGEKVVTDLLGREE